MELKIVGTIEKLMPISKGVSSTGREWVKQDIVMSMANGQFVKHFTAAVMGQERIDNFKLRVGDNIVAYLDVDAKEYNGRWYNSINIWKVERVGANGNNNNDASNGSQQRSSQTQSNQQQSEQMPPKQKQQEIIASPYNNGDDLPF